MFLKPPLGVPIVIGRGQKWLRLRLRLRMEMKAINHKGAQRKITKRHKGKTRTLG
jgi:hypothetical protein